MRNKICIGGISLHDCRSVRLLRIDPRNPAHDLTHHSKKTALNLGDVWDLDIENVADCLKKAPHTEDVVITETRGHYKMSPTDVNATILNCFDVPIVHPSELFSGFIQFTQNARARVTPEGGIPIYSTGFWRFNQPLYLQKDSYGNPRYFFYNSLAEYVSDNKVLDVKYVGFEDPLDRIKAGTILRFSLAGWLGNPPGFWLQLSGWFL